MNRIMFATDLDPHAGNVAAFALAIAENFKAHLTVFHAFGQPHISYGDATPEQREGRVLAELRRLIESVQGPSFAHVQIDYIADIDYPGDGIINQATKGNYDLLICGLREQNEGGEQFSSLSYRILRETPTSVLAIPPQATFHGVKEIIFATDLDTADERVLESLQAWRQNMAADLYVVHVWEDQEDADNARRVMSAWRDRYNQRPRLHFELMEGSFTTDIGDYVKQRGGDMLVLQSETRGFFQRLFGHSNAVEVAHTTTVPLLVMRGE